MTQLKHAYYLVEDHLGEDYFEMVTDDPNQEEFIEETCDECGENDQILAEFDTYKDGKNAIRAQHYNSDYRDEMIRRMYKTVD